MRRRDAILSLLVAAVASPARAQGLPVVGFLGSESPEAWKSRTDAFLAGLADAGVPEGLRVTIQYRWAHGNNARLESLAKELIAAKVDVLVTLGNTQSAVIAKRVAGTTPVVVRLAGDPAALGLVESLGRPGGNVTGWTTLGGEIGPKQLELMREVLPIGAVVGILVNPTNPLLADRQSVAVPEAARHHGFVPKLVRASTDAEITAAFAELAGAGARGLLIGADTFFNSRNDKIAAASNANRLVSVSAYREFAVAGGLISYGGSVPAASREVGRTVARILRGEKPADVPFQQITTLELVVNQRTAQAIGLNLPLSLIARADEILE
ncbi:ABC transporter substrate-binding protein [Alsobacter sp. SYSU BS001988]